MNCEPIPKIVGCCFDRSCQFRKLLVVALTRGTVFHLRWPAEFYLSSIFSSSISVSFFDLVSSLSYEFIRRVSFLLFFKAFLILDCWIVYRGSSFLQLFFVFLLFFRLYDWGGPHDFYLPLFIFFLFSLYPLSFFLSAFVLSIWPCFFFPNKLFNFIGTL